MFLSSSCCLYGNVVAIVEKAITPSRFYFLLLNDYLLKELYMYDNILRIHDIKPMKQNTSMTHHWALYMLVLFAYSFLKLKISNYDILLFCSLSQHGNNLFVCMFVHFANLQCCNFLWTYICVCVLKVRTRQALYGVCVCV